MMEFLDMQNEIFMPWASGFYVEEGFKREIFSNRKNSCRKTTQKRKNFNFTLLKT
jgi:hypothetical protein